MTLFAVRQLGVRLRPRYQRQPRRLHAHESRGFPRPLRGLLGPEHQQSASVQRATPLRQHGFRRLLPLLLRFGLRPPTALRLTRGRRVVRAVRSTLLDREVLELLLQAQEHPRGNSGPSRARLASRRDHRATLRRCQRQREDDSERCLGRAHLGVESRKTLR